MRLIDLPECVHSGDNTTLLSFSMQRSGQHLVIDWICRGLGHVAHFNHSRLYMTSSGLRLKPMTGRVTLYVMGETIDSGKRDRSKICDFVRQHEYQQEFYSMEDVLPTDFAYRSLCRRYGQPVVVILRDPANWLASTLKHPKTTPARVRRKLRKYESLLEMAISKAETGSHIFINFNQFTTDLDYRKKLALQLGIASFELAELALQNVPDFGGGSSFGGKDRKTVTNVGERWREYENDPFYRKSLGSTRLRELSTEFFGQDYLKFLD